MAPRSNSTKAEPQLTLPVVTAAIRLPEALFEKIFSNFDIIRDKGTDRCVRYALGDERQGCFLPLYDHRPTVVEAARRFDKSPDPEAAIALFAEMRRPAGVEIQARETKAGSKPYLNLWPPDGVIRVLSLEGEELDFEPASLVRGVTHWGAEARWYWYGLLPVPGTEGALRLVHLRLR